MGAEDAGAAEAAQGGEATEGGLCGVTFDAGGLIALERNDRRVFSLVDTALEDGARLVVPATALAQVLRNRRRKFAFGE